MTHLGHVSTTICARSPLVVADMRAHAVILLCLKMSMPAAHPRSDSTSRSGGCRPSPANIRTGTADDQHGYDRFPAIASEY